ncbi:hypothetical protein BC938DRAFT_472714 [Jimgerdemannia flammicorona]|uniref:NAD(P)-binding protein n=1 Tax=Jimgerdemannia flammicorona TaxID=994334 RepID=A0A433QTR8_9FUNG|nr:hypothetical protein BC938DRAFT_472714 [Jimgerdemannia flammicorona]
MGHIYAAIQNWVLALGTFCIMFTVIPATFVLFLCELALGVTGLKPKPRKPRNILITSASSGIGAQLALEYAAPGVTLILLANDVDRLGAVARRCSLQGAEVEAITFNLSNKDKLEQLLQTVWSRQTIDLVIANAGTSGLDLRTISWQDMYKHIVDVNITSVYATIMPIFKKMQQRGYGQIAVVSSVASFYGVANMIWYNQSKSALTAFARDLHYLGQQDNIWVSGRLRVIPSGLLRKLSSSSRFIGDNIHSDTLVLGIFTFISAAPADLDATVVTPGLVRTALSTKLQSSLPLIMHVDPRRAAKYIKDGLADGVFLISFPFLEFMATFLAHTLPPNLWTYVTWGLTSLGLGEKVA